MTLIPIPKRSADEIRMLKEFVAKTKFYQRIDFGDGVITKAAFDCEEQIPLMELDMIEFKDKRVLDIGCNAGYFSCYAKSRGAKEVFGFDRNDDQAGKAIAVSQYFHLDVSFGCLNFESDKFIADLRFLRGEEPHYDIVFMFSVFHHAKKPMQMLHNLFNVTKEIAIMEIRTKPTDDPREMKFVPVDNKPRSTFPSVDTMENSLYEVGFANVEILTGAKTPERIIFHATK